MDNENLALLSDSDEFLGIFASRANGFYGTVHIVGGNYLECLFLNNIHEGGVHEHDVVLEQLESIGEQADINEPLFITFLLVDAKQAVAILDTVKVFVVLLHEGDTLLLLMFPGDQFLSQNVLGEVQLEHSSIVIAEVKHVAWFTFFVVLIVVDEGEDLLGVNVLTLEVKFFVPIRVVLDFI